MSREHFRDWRPNNKSIVLLHQCEEILQEYSSYRFTLRQLYYQLVSRNIIPNTDRAYQNLSKLITRARYAGMLDWAAIEDRIRQPVVPTQFENLGELVEAALYSYRLPRWKGQKNYAELWVEKDALASVLRPLANEYHITLMVNRGYSSASAMYEAANRFGNEDERERRYLFYLGDLDPSGEDMVRDIQDRLDEFLVTVDVFKIALTMRQVEEYGPPPNPAKITDPRAADFIARYGSTSWEVDALPPDVLQKIIRAALDDVLDRPLMDAVIEQEEEDKETLRGFVEGLE